MKTVNANSKGFSMSINKAYALIIFFALQNMCSFGSEQSKQIVLYTGLQNEHTPLNGMMPTTFIVPCDDMYSHMLLPCNKGIDPAMSQHKNISQLKDILMTALDEYSNNKNVKVQDVLSTLKKQSPELYQKIMHLLSSRSNNVVFYGNIEKVPSYTVVELDGEDEYNSDTENDRLLSSQEASDSEEQSCCYCVLQ